MLTDKTEYLKMDFYYQISEVFGKDWFYNL